MKLRTRLFLLLLGVVVGFLVPVFFVTLALAESNFRHYVFEGDLKKAAAFAPLLSDYYQKNRSWDGVESILDYPPFTFHAVPAASSRMGVSIHSADPSKDEDWVRERVVLLDSSLTVIVDTKKVLVGTQHPPRHLEDAIEIAFGTQVVGKLLVGTMVDPVLTGFHESFLNAFATTLVAAFVVANVLALLMALLFSRTIAGPILKLNTAARQLAQGGLGVQVSLDDRGKDELSVLFLSFNAMSQALAESDSRKARLLADTAHELRTPITLMRGTLEAILDGVFAPDHETLEPLYKETLRLTKLIDDLQDLQDIHSSTIQPTMVEWSDFLRERGLLFEAAAQEKSIHFLLAGVGAPVHSLADRDRLGQVVTNLLSNALRHTPEEGKIALSLAVRKETVRIVVDDSGPGIPPQERENVFDRLYRLDRSRNAGTGGRGLGLTISRQIVSAHGGAIWIEESPWGGASVIIELPLRLVGT